MPLPPAPCPMRNLRAAYHSAIAHARYCRMCIQKPLGGDVSKRRYEWQGLMERAREMRRCLKGEITLREFSGWQRRWYVERALAEVERLHPGSVKRAV